MTEPSDAAFVQIGNERFPLTLDRAYSYVTRRNDGVAVRFRAILSESESNDGKYAYSFVEINVCHEHGCPATILGKKFGPCNCGGEELWRGILALAGESYEGTSVSPPNDDEQGQVDAPSPRPQST